MTSPPSSLSFVFSREFSPLFFGFWRVGRDGVRRGFLLHRRGLRLGKAQLSRCAGSFVVKVHTRLVGCSGGGWKGCGSPCAGVFVLSSRLTPREPLGLLRTTRPSVRDYPESGENNDISAQGGAMVGEEGGKKFSGTSCVVVQAKLLFRTAKWNLRNLRMFQRPMSTRPWLRSLHR